MFTLSLFSNESTLIEVTEEPLSCHLKIARKDLTAYAKNYRIAVSTRLCAVGVDGFPRSSNS